MRFLSAGRAGQIADILQKENIKTKSDAEWSIAVADADEKVAEVAMTWALIMQDMMQKTSCALTIAAKQTIGEVLQYCLVEGKDVSLVMSQVIPLLGRGWDYGERLVAWSETPEGKRLGR